MQPGRCSCWVCRSEAGPGRRTAEWQTSKADGQQHGDALSQVLPGGCVVACPDGAMPLRASKEGPAQDERSVRILAICFGAAVDQGLHSKRIRMPLLRAPAAAGQPQAWPQEEQGRTCRRAGGLPGLSASGAASRACTASSCASSCRSWGVPLQQPHGCRRHTRCARPCAPTHRGACCLWASSPKGQHRLVRGWCKQLPSTQPGLPTASAMPGTLQARTGTCTMRGTPRAH